MSEVSAGDVNKPYVRKRNTEKIIRSKGAMCHIPNSISRKRIAYVESGELMRVRASPALAVWGLSRWPDFLGLSDITT